MSTTVAWSDLKARAAGKWQLPLLAASMIVLGAGVIRMQPTPAKIPVDQSLKYLDTLITGKFFDRAAEVGRSVLKRTDLSAIQRAQVELRMGRALFGDLASQTTTDQGKAASVIDHYQNAVSGIGGPSPLTAADLEHIGWSLEWQGQFSAAETSFDEAIRAGLPAAADLRRHLIELRREKLGWPPEELAPMVERFLQETPKARLDLRFWAVEERIHLFDLTEDVEGRGKFLSNMEADFAGSDFEQRFEFLRCEQMARSGQFDSAETCLRTLRNAVDPLGSVSAAAGWLLGRVLTADGGPKRPAEGLSFFDDVLRYHVTGTYAVASRIGKAEALLMLDRQDEALASYRAAVADLPTVEEARVVNRAVLRASLAMAAENRRQAGELVQSVEFADLAAQLRDPGDVEQATVFLQPLAQTEAALAEQIARESGAVTGAASRLFKRSAERFAELASLNVFDEKRGTEFSWMAAELYGKAGDFARAIERYRAFTEERPENSLVPRALLRIGQMNQTAGRTEAAIEAFQECYRRFPRTLDGARALIPLTRAHLGLGPDYLESAEKTLRVILEDSEVFTPEAPEFVDGLFLLGEVHERRGDYEQAIVRLREALDRYPSEQRVTRARFLLADAYRKSAMALRREAAQATFAAEIERVRAESASRFTSARELYRGLIRDFESGGPEGLGPLDQLYLQHAYLYEADCYFETQEYEHALKLYELAAGNLRDSARGLAAYVQMINCLVFLGERAEARAVLARAIVVVNGMPDEAFRNSVSTQSRSDWKKYFEDLGASELF